MSKRLIPLLDRVLVEKIIAPTKSVGGILLPESAVSKVRSRAARSSQNCYSPSQHIGPLPPNPALRAHALDFAWPPLHLAN